ncbi:tape measure protein [Ligilactobacillus pobuzihii]|uniref:tape measure protein n=1 Tax=Ligilactobacillus pobuzihii TaxID=449659 RepID=UPI0019D03A2F|nr:tape measure protein [Ligilactobacillus pobuzihii]MBN7275106.1 tape measure protein [Ligilactobacillus pobuzihii]
MAQTVRGVFTADISGYTGAMNRMQKSTSSATKGILGGNKANTGSMIKFGAVTGAAAAIVSKGMRFVADSVGGAVDRFDTLNKYPTVMKALGYSTRDTNKSMRVLNKGIDGLPTSLDEITRSAQDFAPLTGGATSGAKAAVALNDAFLASGASVADASRGMTQYSQMLATGKVDLMSYRTLQETMPIALRKVANAFGFTGKSAEQDLFQALKKGKITVDDLNKKFIDLDKGQNGFAQLARKNSVGIKTSFANIKTSVIKGLASMLTALDDGLAKAKLPGIAQMMNNMKDGINKGFDVINKIIVKAIPIIVNSFKKIFDFAKQNADWLKPLTLGILTFVATFNSIQKVIGIVSKVGGAFKNFFSILSANPIVATIALIAALSAGLVYFFTQTKNGKKLWSDLVNIFSGSTGAFIAVAGAVALVGGGLALLLKKIIQPAKPLDELGKHFGTTGQSAGKSAAQIAAVGVKAAGIGIGIGAAAAGFGVFAMGIAKMASAGSSGLIALAALTASIVILAGTFALLKGPLTAAIPAMLSLSVAMLSAGASALMIGGAVALAGAGINMAGSGVLKLTQAFILLGTNMAMIVPTMTAVGQGFAMMITSFVTTLAAHIPQVSLAIVSMMLNMLTTINTYMPAIMQQGVQLIVNFITGLAQGLPMIIAAATNLIVNFLNALAMATPQIAVAGVNLVVALAASIGTNAARVVGAAIALIGQLASAFVTNLPILVQIMGATMAAIVAIVVTYVGSFRAIGGVLMEALKAGLTGKKFDVVGKSSEIIQSAGTTASKNGKAAFDAAGGNSGIAAAQAIANKKGNANSAGSSLAGAGANGVKGKQGQFKSAGSGNGSAAAGGISSKSDAASKAGSSLGKSGASGARGAHGSFKSAGGFLGQGLVNGIGSMAGAAMKAAASIASKAAGAIKKALDINSPSRVTAEFGMYFGAGFVRGINGMQPAVERAAANLADVSTSAMDDLNGTMSPSMSVSRNLSDQFDASFDDSSMAQMARMIVKAIDEKDTDLILDGDSVVKKTSGRMDNELGNNVRLRSRFS